MKKLLVFVLIICCLCSTMFFKVESNPLFDIDGVTSVCLVSNQNLGESDNEIESIECGDVIFNYCSLEKAKKHLKEVKSNLQGLQFYFENKSFEALKKDLKMNIVSVEELENLVVYCGYCPYFSNSIILDGKKINVQIAVSSDKVVAGFPVILTGY